MALDNAHLHDALRVQAIRDSKTSLFTHDYLLDSISRELGRAAREGDSTALVMVDVDDYKQFNDTYGHVAGDKVLADLAAIIMATVRASDTPVRFVGEEFSILLPGTSHEEAMVIAERIRQSIADHEAELKPGFHARVTVSVGVAVHSGPSTNPDTILEAADSALYDSKRSGKDTVRLAPTLAVTDIANALADDQR